MDDFWNNDDDEPDWFEKDNDDVTDEVDGNNDENDGDDANSSSGGTHHILILIDCDPIMFTTTTTTQATTSSSSYMNECIKAIQSVVRNKIRTVTIYKAGKRDGIGIILYNTKYRTPLLLTVPSTGNMQEDEEDGLTTKLNDGDNDDEEDDEEDDDNDRLLFGLQHGSSSHLSQSHVTNVHELIPLEPPGVSTMELIQRTLLLASQSSSSSSSINLEKEYCRTSNDDDTMNATIDNDDDDDEIISQMTHPSSATQLPPLLYALRKAMTMYNTASCVKKTRTTSAGKWEEPDSKHIWIITPHDDPCSPMVGGTSSSGESSSIERDEMIRVLRECVTDIQENDIQIHVWPIVVTTGQVQSVDPVPFISATFDRSIFYNSITATGSSDNNHTMTSTDWVHSLDAVYKKTRPAYRVPFLLPNWKQKYQQSQSTTGSNSNDDNNNISQRHVLYLDMYNVHQIQKEPSVVPIHQSTGKLLGKVRQLVTLDDGGGQIVAEQRSYDPKSKINTATINQQRLLRTYFEFGNEYVPFSLRDKVSIKKKCNTNSEFASLILLGFKPAASIPFYHTIEKSYFAYPSESNNRNNKNNNNSNNTNHHSNSIDAIAHLHGSMIRQNVIGIGELLTRATATSRLVVIRPIQEVLRPLSSNNNEDGEEENEKEDAVYMLVRPPGLLISAIPFEDEMRMSAAASAQQNDTDVTEGMINAAMDLIEKQTFDDDIEIGVDFSNAAMSRFWNYIEHIAYNDDAIMDDTQRYDTEIDVAQVLERSGKQIDHFVSLLPETVQPEKVVSGRKRKTTASSLPSTQKQLADDITGLDWLTIFHEGTLSKCTVADLKSKLRSIGEPVAGNKSVLVERLQQYYAAVGSSHPIKQESDISIKEEDNCI